MEFFVCFDEFYKMAKKHDGVKKIVVHFFLKSVIQVFEIWSEIINFDTEIRISI